LREFLLQLNACGNGLIFSTYTVQLLPEDYDGDSKADISVFSNGIWYSLQS